ncbi:MAG: MraY family glycosyltransferase [Planctomycetota bacterium]|nr:MraY family glycosyltransferase [Planctomycetota bacterium]
MFTIAFLLIAGSAFLATYFLTPKVRQLAFQRNFVDRPDGRRKMQKAPVSLGGGAAILCGLLIGAVVLALGWNQFELTSRDDGTSLIGLLIATLLLCGVGLVDDARQIRGRTKLFWQFVAASIITFSAGELLFEQVNFFGSVWHVGALGSVIALFWLVGSINSFNLIDGVDGLCATVGAIFGITFGIMALITNNQVDAIIAFTLSAALLGFLRCNFAPATIYLGDAGSMIIGLILGTLALRCSTKSATTIAFAAPLAVWAIPMLDSFAAVLRRKLTGRSIYTTDRGHIHHRLLTQGLSTRQAVGMIAILCVLTSLGSIAGIYFESQWIGILTVGLVISTLIVTRVFGHVELMLLNSRLVGWGRSIVSFKEIDRSVQCSHQLQGTIQWEEKIWNALVESAERFRLTRLQLNLYLPHLHEDFYATWKQKECIGAPNRTWRMDLPLVVDGMAVGNLHVVGDQDERGASVQLATFLDFVEPLEAQIQELLAISTELKLQANSPTLPTPVIGVALASMEQGSAFEKDQLAAEMQLPAKAATVVGQSVIGQSVPKRHSGAPALSTAEHRSGNPTSV